MRRLALAILLIATLPAVSQAIPPSLPDVPTLLRDVEAHQKAAEAAQRNYLYRVTTTRTETDSQGDPKKTTTTVADSLTLRGIRVNRVLSRNGRPLSVDEQKKEIDRIDKQVDKANDRLRRAAEQGKPVTPNGEDEITVSRFLQLGTFSNLRRELTGGRPTLIVDFAGDPHAKSRNASEGLIRDLAGTLWIDEQDRAITRIEGHAVANFHVGLGLVADLKKGTSFSLQNVKVNNEAWLPAQIDAQGSLRYLLFFSFTGNVRILCSDYRKFQATATILSISSPGQPADPTAAEPPAPASVPPPAP
jgi:hypothetical protein